MMKALVTGAFAVRQITKHLNLNLKTNRKAKNLVTIYEFWKKTERAER